MFLPGFLLGLASCWHRGILKTFIVLMPTFTNFTFASNTKWCKRSSKKEGKEEDANEEESKQQENEGGKAEEEPFIIFSAKFTCLNVATSIICPVVYGLGMTQMAAGRDFTLDTWIFGIPGDYPSLYLYVGVPLCILGLLLPLIPLALTTSPRQTCCCFTCFALPRVEYGVLLTTSLHSHYVLGANGKPELVLGDEEETEMRTRKPRRLTIRMMKWSISNDKKLCEPKSN